MATARIKLKSKKYSDGKQPVQLIIRSDKEYVKTLGSIFSKDWDQDKSRVRKSNPNWIHWNTRISNELNSAEMYIEKCRILDELVNPTSFFANCQSEYLVDLINDKISKLRKDNKYKTATRIESVITKLDDFNCSKIKVDEINYDWVVAFDRFLIDHYNNKLNTRERIHREIRVFAKSGYEFFKLKREASFKDKLNRMEIAKFENIDLVKGEDLARDVFLFSYNCRGMRVHDCFIIKNENIRGDRVQHYLQKSNFTKFNDVKLNPKALALIKKWKGVSKFGYVFPICLMKFEVSEVFSKHIDSRNSFIRIRLKRICVKLEIDKKISMHNARYSYAVQKYKDGVPIQAIQKALGHSDPQTTVIYLKHEINASELDAALGE